MEKEAVIEAGEGAGLDPDAPVAGDRSLAAQLREAEERIRLLERDKLVILKESADARRPVEEALKEAKAALEAAEARVVELEGERDEISALLEKFLAENWGDLKERTPAEGVPVGITDFLLDAESRQRDALASGSEPVVGPPPVRRPAGEPPPAPPRSRAISSREDLLEVLAAGAAIETTGTFSRFQPVKTSHIKISDWLQRAHDYEALLNLARNEVSEQELVDVLYLFLHKAFIRIES